MYYSGVNPASRCRYYGSSATVPLLLQLVHGLRAVGIRSKTECKRLLPSPPPIPHSFQLQLFLRRPNDRPSLSYMYGGCRFL